MIEDLLTNKNSDERAEIKAVEIAKLDVVGEFTTDQKGESFAVEIQSLSKVEGGIEVLAKASKDGKPIGFGDDGSVEIERFIFINPPILVPDGTFHTETFEGVDYEVPNYTENPTEALHQALIETIKQVQKGDENIVAGKVGSTVTTVFATYGAMVRNDGSSETWATLHDATVGDLIDTTDQRFAARWDSDSASGRYNLLSRSGFTFDTSSIPDTSVISAAVLSIFGDAVTNSNGSGNTIAINVYSFTPASSTAYVTGDFDQFGTTDFSTEIVWGSWSTSAYNNFTLNASGLANINKTGNSVFGSRESNFDAPNIAPTWSSSKTDQFGYRNYNASGTTNDPKLVITHAGLGATIAFGAALGLAEGGTSTLSKTGLSLTGNNRIIIVGVATNDSACTGVVFDDGAGGGSQSFTQLGSNRPFGAGQMSVWYLVAPTVGAGRRIIASFGGTSYNRMGAVYYTGVAQSSTFTTPTQATDTATPGTDTDTSDTDNSWQIGFTSAENAGLSLTSGGVDRQHIRAAVVDAILADSDVDVIASVSNSLNYSWTSASANWVSAMMRPAGVATSSGNFFLVMG